MKNPIKKNLKDYLKSYKNKLNLKLIFRFFLNIENLKIKNKKKSKERNFGILALSFVH